MADASRCSHGYTYAFDLDIRAACKYMQMRQIDKNVDGLRTEVSLIDKLPARWLTGIGGTVVIGIASSGLWEIAIKPILAWVAEITLQISTLGIDLMRDKIYQDVALGVNERAGLQILQSIAGTITAFTIFIVISMFWIICWKNKRVTMGDVKIFPSGRFGDVLFSDRMAYINAGLILFMIATINVSVVQTQYATAAEGHIKRLITIASPFIEEKEIKSLNARVALISSRSDYISIMEHIAAIIKSNGEKVPKFDVF